MYCDYLDCIVGRVVIVANDEVLLSITLSDKPLKQNPNSLTDEAKRWLDAYFKKKNYPLPPLKRARSPFSAKVREEVMKIAFGECRTYSDIAKAIGEPKAYRGVAQVMKYNPFMIIVPCHRVIAKSGLGGYNGGIEIKKRLLEFEGCESISL